MLLTRPLVALILILTVVFSAHAADKFTNHTFKKTQLSNEFFSEGANFADFNRDGDVDVVSGPFWYAGPKFTERHAFYDGKPFNVDGYSDNFFAFTHDFNHDEWPDILIVGFPGKEAFWYENPQGKPGPWPRHVAIPVVDNESPQFTDVTGDGQPDLVCMSGGFLGYAEIPADPAQAWEFTEVSPKRDYQRFTHGLGVGDVNGDGRMDLLVKDGWYEQSADPGEREAFDWPFHEFLFTEPGGAHMYAYDFDGDGDNDVVTSKEAHSYGLAWFENQGPGEGGGVKFAEHKITGARPEENEYGVAFSQLHAVDLVDMDGDGVKDIITGKRWWAHSQHDPGSLEPAVLYWFKTARDGGKVRFIPYLIDDNSGVGTQVVVGDVTGDKLPDIVVGSKKGTFVHTHRAEEVDEAAWKEAQPKLREEVAKPQAAGDVAQPAADSSDGFPATAADGRALNLDFETGDLADWTAEGAAFDGQPVEGDTVHARRDDSYSGHRGVFWIGSGEIGGTGPQGALTSVPFKVTHPFASMLVGGDAGKALVAQVVRSDTGEVVFEASGLNMDEMRPVAIDLSGELDREIFLRIVDRAGQGRINFDHFRFHDERPIFKEAVKSVVRASDHYPHAGLPAEEAVKAMKLPDGFRATVFAAEPDVKQPIAMALDHRGRLWIAEAYEYPVRAAEGQGRDRILIFADADGDGKFDSRKVFAEGLNLVSGMELGFGGVWVGAAPYLMFIPDRDGDDRADGEPEILLDGWAYEDTHETLNTFIWGPDGWLYGCHGVFTHSRVGKPGTPDDKRTPLNGAIWRYHPTRHEFEIFTEGTSNPWGVDFDDHGQAFSTACVIPHLYYNIPGGRYQRQAGSHFNPYTYDDIKTIADHRHYLGDHSHARNDSSGDAGGGHAHAGAMIYLGGAWPEEYRGRIFMNNIHGQRVNTDILKPRGSGYVGSHGPDFLLTGDLASQILNMRYGPDGNAYVIDWYDTNACHHHDVAGHDRSNGRIYKVSYGDAKPESVDLTKLSDLELAELVLHKNDWYVRHARRLMQERAAIGEIDETASKRLADIATSHPDATRRLRAIWALNVSGELSRAVWAMGQDSNEHVRAWLVRLTPELSGAAAAQWQMTIYGATADPSPVVRLAAASFLQRLPLDDRWPHLEGIPVDRFDQGGLIKHAEDANDHNLPLMYWYAMEPLADVDPTRALALGLSCGKTIPVLRKFMIQRIASGGSPAAFAALTQRIIESNDGDEHVEILRGLSEALKGQRQASPPDNWPAAFAKLLASDRQDHRMQAISLGVTFGDQQAMEALRETVQEVDADPAARRQALEALLGIKDPQLLPILLRLLAEPDFREAALTGLSQYDDPSAPVAILRIYADLKPQEKRAALATLCSRAAYGLELLKAVAAAQIAAADIPADLVRQLQNLKHAELDRMLVETWGQVRNTPEDKAKLIAELRELMAKPPATPDHALGRAVFAKTCQQCHTLYGAGAKIGPELTGSNRADLEYLLSNIVDPSAVITKDYQQTVVMTIDGLVVSGLLKTEDDKSVTLQTPTDLVVIPKDEIDERQLSDASMMPDDQLKQFTPQQIVSLFAYLGDKVQAPILASKDNQELFFNGKDLTGWTGNAKLWTVENGEIVGRSEGLDHNEFLFSELAADDFALTFEVKLFNDGDKGNSGVQFRSQPLDSGEAKGYQADIGPGWWGKLYEESDRGLLWDKPGEQHVKKGDWNEYKIVARGSHVQTWINGKACVDLDDPKGDRRGQFALQLHAGEPLEVRFRNLKLEVLE